jgi:hypothetical protein
LGYRERFMALHHKITDEMDKASRDEAKIIMEGILNHPLDAFTMTLALGKAWAIMIRECPIESFKNEVVDYIDILIESPS